MITYEWELLELFANESQLIAVRYSLSATDGINTVITEGKHDFLANTANKPLEIIVEQDIIQWLEQDTTQNGVNLIKLAVENQLKSLETVQKIDFPWLAGTFTIE